MQALDATSYYNSTMRLRLQKYLAELGVASRRKCEEYIAAGLIKVNGQVTKVMGVTVDPEKDKVEVDSSIKRWSPDNKQDFVYYALNKPVGYVSAVSGPEEPKITSLIDDASHRVFPVGRLDKLSCGLILLTNDGRFAYMLTHPSHEKEKEYVVKVREKVTPEVANKMSERFYIQGKKTMAAQIFVKGAHRMHIILKEGRNRQIRRMCQRAGLHIEKLKRVRIGPLGLGELKPGKYRPLTAQEVKTLMSIDSAQS